MTYSVQRLSRGWWITLVTFGDIQAVQDFIDKAGYIQPPYRVVDSLGEQHLYVGDGTVWVEGPL